MPVAKGSKANVKPVSAKTAGTKVPVVKPSATKASAPVEKKSALEASKESHAKRVKPATVPPPKSPAPDSSRKTVTEDKKRVAADIAEKDAKPVKKVKAVEVKAKQSEAAAEQPAPAPASKAKGKAASTMVRVPAKPAIVDTSATPKRGQLELACTALLQHVEAYKKAAKQQKLALPGVSKEDQTIFVQMTLRRMPEQATKTFKGRPIPLPHPFHSLENTTVCAFVKDKAEAKKWLGDDYEKHGIKKMISLQQLRTDFKSFEAKRALAEQYDAFVADDRIVCMLPKALGKTFYVGSKRPLPIRLAKKEELSGSAMKKVEKALGSTFFYLSGVSTSIRAGTSAQPESQIVDNVEAIINGAVEHVPGKWKGVQSIFIKSEKSAALPIYEAPISTLHTSEGADAA